MSKAEEKGKKKHEEMPSTSASKSTPDSTISPSPIRSRKRKLDLYPNTDPAPVADFIAVAADKSLPDSLHRLNFQSIQSTTEASSSVESLNDPTILVPREKVKMRPLESFLTDNVKKEDTSPHLSVDAKEISELLEKYQLLLQDFKEIQKQEESKLPSDTKELNRDHTLLPNSDFLHIQLWLNLFTRLKPIFDPVREKIREGVMQFCDWGFNKLWDRSMKFNDHTCR